MPDGPATLLSDIAHGLAIHAPLGNSFWSDKQTHAVIMLSYDPESDWEDPLDEHSPSNRRRTGSRARRCSPPPSATSPSAAKARRTRCAPSSTQPFGIRPDSHEGRQLLAEDPHASAFAVDTDRTPALRLADALSGGDAMGRRARLTLIRVMDHTAMGLPAEERWALSEAAERETLALLHATDDPEPLAALVWSSIELTPSDDAIMKALFLSLQHASKKWTMPIRKWDLALQ